MLDPNLTPDLNASPPGNGLAEHHPRLLLEDRSRQAERDGPEPRGQTRARQTGQDGQALQPAKNRNERGEPASHGRNIRLRKSGGASLGAPISSRQLNKAVFDAEVEILQSMSRYGRISLSLMNPQMMRVISSPSSSTTGVFALIFAVPSSS
jgi:hypothetical protein